MCLAILNAQPPRDTTACFNNAFESYLQLQDVRHATRCALWAVDLYR